MERCRERGRKAERKREGNHQTDYQRDRQREIENGRGRDGSRGIKSKKAVHKTRQMQRH